jgi:MFS family permease
MRNRSVQEQVISGLQLAGSVVLACLAGIFFVWSASLVAHGDRRSVILACAVFAVGLAILVLNLDAWARMLPGFLALAAFNSLVTAKSGHIISSSTQVSRGVALGSAFAFVIGSVASAHFHDKRLTTLDRFALVAYVIFILLAFMGRWVVCYLALGALILAIPWLVSKMRSREKI